MKFRNMAVMLKTLQSPRLGLAVFVCVCIFTIDVLWLGYIPESYCRRVVTVGQTWDKVPQTPGRTVYVITPTYRRATQLAELTRLAQTLMNVPDLVWLLIEDAKTKTKAVERLLLRTKMKFVHLTAPMPEKYKVNITDITKRPRGVASRNRGLRWLRANATAGVFYFADDDNSYDIRIFEEIRYTTRVSMFPVGFLLGGFSAPVLRNGVVQGFCVSWSGPRIFQMDMAGFAVSVEFLLKRPKARMPYKNGFEEDGFLRSLKPFNVNEIECKASGCTEILVWHTQTKTPMPQRTLNLTLYENSNIVKLYNSEMENLSD